MNALAEAMLGGDLRLTYNRLHALDRQSDQRLQGLINCALASRKAGSHLLSPVFVARREGHRPYIVEAMLVTGPKRDLSRHLTRILVITDLDGRLRMPVELIREAFGLTSAEARLATTLGSGEDLRTAAEIHGMAYETARRHLKAIFSKAAVNRQSELVTLLIRLSLGTSSTVQ
jgi:DNA-binding CsgD family transcriptional regulator